MNGAVNPCPTRSGATIRIERTHLDAEVSRALITELNAELSGAYPEPGATHFGLRAEEVGRGHGAFLVIYEGATPVGCGAVRRIDPNTAELKRMYVVLSRRGNGIGRQLIEALESEARALNVRRMILETGIRQAAARALYERSGFKPIPLYGEYLRSPETSLCLGKELIP